MKYALSLPNAGSPDRLIDVACEAEPNGWDAVFLWDHIHLFRDMRLELHDPWVILGAIARSTSRVKLGTVVTPLPRRRPQKYAKEIVTLDHLSGGRVIAGVGLGSPPADEFAQFGEIDDDRHRASLLDEALELVIDLWSGDPVDHRGEHYTVSAHLRPPPVQKPRPPIWVGAQYPNRRPLARAKRFEGVAPIGPDGQPLGLAELRVVADLVGPGVDVCASWLPGPTVDDYAEAGATWLIESRWPDGDWLDELATSAATDPRPATAASRTGRRRSD